jgi:PAS domain S-box-containing protein
MEHILIENILDSLTESILVVGPDGEVLYANGATERVLGCDLRILLDRGLGMTFFTMEENTEFNQVFVDAIIDKNLRNYSEVKYFHPDGSTMHLAVTTSYLVDSEKIADSFIGFVAIFKDITEIVQLREREKRLIEARQRAAEEQVASLQKLAAGVAHEIRNPVVTIGGFASRLLKLQSLPDVVGKHAEIILKNAQKLETVVQEVQRYCDIRIADITAKPVSDLVESAVASQMESGAAKGVAIEFQDQLPGDSICWCDPALLRVAFTCLIENAIFFSPERSVISVVLSGTNESIELVIRDGGPGIAENDMSYVFNPFFSTRADKPGMGLPTVQKIVNEHLGSMSIESGPKIGTVVKIALPRRPSEQL